MSQIERSFSLLLYEFLRGALFLIFGQVCQVEQHKRQVTIRGDNLDEVAAFNRKSCAQHFMTRHHRTQRSLQQINSQLAAQPHHSRYVIKRTSRLELTQKDRKSVM